MHKYFRAQNSSPIYRNVIRMAKRALYRDLCRPSSAVIPVTPCRHRREQPLVQPADLLHRPVTGHSPPRGCCLAVTRGEVHDLSRHGGHSLSGLTIDAWTRSRASHLFSPVTRTRDRRPETSRQLRYRKGCPVGPREAPPSTSRPPREAAESVGRRGRSHTHRMATGTSLPNGLTSMVMRRIDRKSRKRAPNAWSCDG